MAKSKSPEHSTDRELAEPMVLSIYPTERDELFRLQAEHGLRTPFDVVRKALLDSGLPKKNTIRPAKHSRAHLAATP